MEAGVCIAGMKVGLRYVFAFFFSLVHLPLSDGTSL